MNKNLTPQRERFAELVASGLSYADAYREAYPKSKSWKDDSVYCESSKLMANTKVLQRVDMLKEKVIEDIKYDVNDCFREFEDIQKRAKESEDLKTEVKIVENKGKLKQLFVDNKNITHDGSIKTRYIDSEEKEATNNHIDSIINDC